jgi:histidyl-tRNA synthetase
MKYKTLKGLQDILPPDISIWHHIEEQARDIFHRYGYREIRLPIIEPTELFIRSIGETSDIVEKEMYTFEDKGGRSVTLRPEGTASFVRAYVQHHLYNDPAPQKYYYMGPMFRYERPQAHRYRQFYQIGVEAMGIEDPLLDAEIITMLNEILSSTGLRGLLFEVTSIGCPVCRPSYRDALREFLGGRLDAFCSDCRRRFDLNPLRILDCKVPSCIESREGAPPVTDYLCGECGTHFRRLQENLDLLGVPYEVNPNLVRGLDYYTKTAFEVSSESLGSQKAVAAGGRYDGMVKEFGGPPTPGIGFAIGMERLIPLLKDSTDTDDGPDLFLCTMDENALKKAVIMARDIRSAGYRVEMSYEAASLRSQMRKADRMKSRHVIVIGENELESGKVMIKNMRTGDSVESAIDAREIIGHIIRPGE